jgi:hypothetical protein
MTILLVLLILLLILVFLKLLFSHINEGFQDIIPLDPQLLESYDTFQKNYNIFCDSWLKAVSSGAASNIPQEPLTSPSQVGTSSGSAPEPSQQQLADFIAQLSQQLQQSFPPICVPIPEQLTSESLAKVLSLIPEDPQPIQNALNWMNSQMEKSHDDLNNALQGIPPTIEGFDAMCDNLTQCIANNPQLAQQIAQQVNQQQEEKKTNDINQLQQDLMTRLNNFNKNQDLNDAIQKNQDLVAKSEDVKKQAQSGQIVNQINIPDAMSSIPFQIPEGGNALQKMKTEDPQQYEDLKNNHSNWFSIKQLMEQINSNLR